MTERLTQSAGKEEGSKKGSKIGSVAVAREGSKVGSLAASGGDGVRPGLDQNASVQGLDRNASIQGLEHTASGQGLDQNASGQGPSVLPGEEAMGTAQGRDIEAGLSDNGGGGGGGGGGGDIISSVKIRGGDGRADVLSSLKEQGDGVGAVGVLTTTPSSLEPKHTHAISHSEKDGLRQLVDGKPSVAAFITFEYQESRERCLYDFKLWSSFPRSWLVWCLYPKNMVLQGKRLVVTMAPEPDEIVWENLEISNMSRGFRSIPGGFSYY